MPSFKNPLKRKNKPASSNTSNHAPALAPAPSTPSLKSHGDGSTAATPTVTAIANGKQSTADEIQEFKDYERVKQVAPEPGPSSTSTSTSSVLRSSSNLNPTRSHSRSRNTAPTQDMSLSPSLSSADSNGHSLTTQTSREMMDSGTHTNKQSGAASMKVSLAALVGQHKHFVIPFSIIVATYFCGYLSLGVLSLLLLVVVWSALTLRTKILTQDPQYIVTLSQRVAKASQAQDLASIRYLLQHMPGWVEFSDVERANWLSTMLEIMWPSMKQATEDSILQALTPIFDSVRPKWMKRLGFEVCDMGDSPPFVAGVKHYYTAEENVTVDFNVMMAGNVNIIVVAEIGPVVLQVQVQHLVFSGSARLVLTGLIPSWPCFSGIDVSFVSKPNIDFSLTAAGIPIMNIPGADTYIIQFIKQQMANVLVWPAKISVPLVVETPEQKALRLAREPKGVLRVALVEARDIASTDTFGKSDPYARITVEGQEHKTEISSHTLYPKWKEKFEYIVNQPDKEVVHVAIADWEKVGYGKSIGEVDIPISIVLGETSYQDIWVPLNHAKSGSARVQLDWSPFVNPAEDTHDSNVEVSSVLFVTLIKATGIESVNPNVLDKSLGTALDMVPGLGMVPGLNKLGFNDNGVYCTLTVGSHKCKSEKINDAVDPRWDQKFQFPIRTASLERLNVKLKGMSMGRSMTIGEFYVDLSDVMKTGKAKDAFSFQGGVPGTIHMALELKQIKQSHPPPPPPANCPGILEIILHSGRDLVAADSNGFSDPFVKFTLGTHKPVQSKTVSKTLNPDWGDARFELPVSDIHNDALICHVYDYDRFSSNDPLGDLFVAMPDLLGRGKITNEWPLQHTNKGALKLSLHLKPSDPSVDVPCIHGPTVPSFTSPSGSTTDTKLTNNRNIITQFVPKTVSSTVTQVTSGITKFIPGVGGKKDKDKEKKEEKLASGTGAATPAPAPAPAPTATATAIASATATATATSTATAQTTSLRESIPGGAPPLSSSTSSSQSQGQSPPTKRSPSVGPAAAASAPSQPSDDSVGLGSLQMSVDGSGTDPTPRFHSESEMPPVESKDTNAGTGTNTPQQGHSRNPSNANATGSPALSRSPSISRIGQVSMSKTSKSAPYQLSITIHCANQLPTLHHTDGPSAYVKVRVGKRLRQTHRGRKTRDPVYEESFTFGVADPSTETVFFRVKDHHMLSSNERIGETQLAIKDLLANNMNQLVNHTLQLTQLDHTNNHIVTQGTITVSATLKQLH